MTDFVNQGQWDEYSNILNKFNNSVAKKKITFRKFRRTLSQFKEDIDPTKYDDITLECLINYNYLRTWPATVTSEAGELDRDSMQVLFNKKYLQSMGLLTVNTNLDYNPDYDRFIVDGQIKKAMGNTAASQAGSEDILYTLILKNEEIDTGQSQVR